MCWKVCLKFRRSSVELVAMGKIFRPRFGGDAPALQCKIPAFVT